MRLFRNNHPALELRPIVFLSGLTNQPDQAFPSRLTEASEIDSSGQFTCAGTLKSEHASRNPDAVRHSEIPPYRRMNQKNLQIARSVPPPVSSFYSRPQGAGDTHDEHLTNH